MLYEGGVKKKKKKLNSARESFARDVQLKSLREREIYSQQRLSGDITKLTMLRRIFCCVTKTIYTHTHTPLNKNRLTTSL